MKAVFLENGKIQVRDAEKPVPAQHEALIKVLRAGICQTDLELVKGYMNFSGILGHEFVGRVVESPEEQWMGKRVVGEINVSCDSCPVCLRGESRHCPSREVMGILRKDGAFAEYLTLPLKNLHPVPDSVADTEAVFVEPLAAACEVLEQVRIDEKTSVAVLGDGKLGLLIAQVMRLNTPRVSCFGKHDHKLKRLKGKGIQTYDGEAESGAVYDVVVEATGSSSGLQRALKMVRPKGCVVLKSTIHGESFIDVSKVVVDEISVIGSRCGPFDRAIRILEQGFVLVRDLVDREFQLDRASEAFVYAQDHETVKVLLVP